MHECMNAWLRPGCDYGYGYGYGYGYEWMDVDMKNE